MQQIHRQILTASLVGTAIEFYDFYIYATAASLVFGALFFPSQAPATQLLASYATFAVAFFARPVGGVVFGHYGDRIGRKATLVASLLLMGGSTFAIAFLPGYATAGVWAPILLCLLRFGQGLGLGGEWGGAVLLAVENAPRGWESRYGMFPQLGAPVGFIVANGLFLVLGLLLTPQQFMDYGWRLPFLASAGLVAIGLWVRLSLVETPAFAALLKEHTPAPVPLLELFRQHGLATVSATLGVIAAFAIFYIATAFTLGFGTTKLGYTRETFLLLQILAIVFLAIGIVVAAILSDFLSSKVVLIGGCVAMVITGLLMAPLFGSGTVLGVWSFMSLALLVMGFVYGPLGGWLSNLFPARVRYTGVCFGVNMGGIIGGGLAPIIASALVARGGLTWVGLYLVLAAVLSLLGIIVLGRSQVTAPRQVRKVTT